MGTKSWRSQITERLRLEVTIRTAKGQVVDIALQLLGHIDGEWTRLVRNDNAHGTCHRHTSHPDGTETKHEFLAILPATFLDQAQQDLQKNAGRYLDDYERELSNMKRGI
ncbi:MAG TPA: hypothetical protein VIM30_16350 [Candidatus Limnocylindrales bacterium]